LAGKSALAHKLQRGSHARFASEGWWGRKDSNLRSHEAADLQSAPFATRDTPPLDGIAIRFALRRRRIGHGEVKTATTPYDGSAIRRVYEGSTMAKSTKAIPEMGADRAQIAIIRNP
jgi:hypothetical protein